MALFSLSTQLFNPRENTLGFFTPRTERGHLNSQELLSSGRFVGSELFLSGSSHSTCKAPELFSSDLTVTFPGCDQLHVFPCESAGVEVNIEEAAVLGEEIRAQHPANSCCAPLQTWSVTLSRARTWLFPFQGSPPASSAGSGSHPEL